MSRIKKITKRGRPLVITEDRTREMEELLRVGATVNQACDYAGISTPTYYEMIARSEDFANRMSHAQSFLNVSSKRIIADAIVNECDLNTSKWLLEKTEYRPKESVGFATDNGDNQVKIVISRG